MQTPGSYEIRGAPGTMALEAPVAHRPFGRLLVPVDGSAQAEQPLALALAIARAAQSDLHLVWVRPPEAQRRTEAGRPSTRMSYLETLTEVVTDRLGAPVCRHVLAGRPADSILKQAIEADIDLILMASRGHGALWRLGIGSTTDSVLRNSPVPVLVMRAPDEDEPDLARPVRLDEIVIALDGSDAAESVLGPALELARLMHSGITLLRIVETPVLPLDHGTFGIDLTRESVAVEVRIAHAYLDHVAGRLRAGGLAVNTAVRDASTACAGIERFVREADADLVALGTRGMGGARHILRGGTVSRLLHDGPVPVLVANPGAAAT